MRVFAIVLIAFVVCFSLPQTSPANAESNRSQHLYPIKKYIGSWDYTAFINQEGKEVIPPIFNAHPFHDGLALAEKEDNKIGFIDQTGTFVIPPTYSDTMYIVGDFRQGLTYVWKVSDMDSKIIDKTGKTVIPFGKYKSMEILSNGLIKVAKKDAKTNKWIFGIINRAGKVIVPPKYNFLGDFSEGLAAAWMEGGNVQFLNEQGKVTVRTSYKSDDGHIKFGSGLIPLKDSKGKCVLVNKQGKAVVKTNYTDVGNFSEGLASFHGPNGTGFMDTKGKTVIKTDFFTAGEFKEGFALLSDMDGNTWLINKQGKKLVPQGFPEYSTIGPMENGLALVVKWKGTTYQEAYINSRGEVVYKSPVFNFANGN